MVDDFLHQPLGGVGLSPVTTARRWRSAAWLLVAIVVVAGGLFFWARGERAPRSGGVTARIEQVKPAPPSALQPVSAGAPPSAGDESGVAVMRPPGSPSGTGIFIKVPQDDAAVAAKVPAPPRAAKP